MDINQPKPDRLTQYPNLVFWGCYLTLNFLLFLPAYLLSQETTAFFPFSITTSQHPLEAIKQVALWRDNLDIFRINSELLLLIALWVYVPWLRRPFRQRIFRWLLGGLYVTILLYALFENVILTLYQVELVFYNHFQLAVSGVQVLARNMHFPLSLYLLIGAGLVAGGMIIGMLIKGVIHRGVADQLSGWSKMAVALLAFLVMVSLVGLQDFLANPQMQVSSFVYKLRRNIAASTIEYRNIRAFDDAAVQSQYDFTGYRLQQKLNIHLIFVESYGSVLVKRPHYREAYTTLLRDLETRLQAHNWQTTSTLSTAPTWGGGSWLSYTTTLFGLHVDTHPQYLALLEQYQTASYPDLGHFLKSQGYDYIRLSSPSTKLSQENQLALQNFYGVDRWQTYHDLNFKGQHFGWGLAPPDQYSLFYAQETFLSQLTKPFFFFYVTQNSHFPWTPLPEFVDDWRRLNEQADVVDRAPSSVISTEAKRQNYLRSIDYELTVLTDYIIKTGNSDDIFILIGDHQPPQVSRHSDSFATPVHIIGQDAVFINHFLAYGLVPGLVVEDVRATMSHEDLYPMVVHLLLLQYGEGAQAHKKLLPLTMVPGQVIVK